MKTGNTRPVDEGGGLPEGASMEPGHEDREYGRSRGSAHPPAHGLNGARS